MKEGREGMYGGREAGEREKGRMTEGKGKENTEREGRAIERECMKGGGALIQDRNEKGRRET